MRFVDRGQEIKLLKNCRELSKNKPYTLAIYGLRRVGKTRLILEALRKEDFYFFVNKHKTSESLLSEYESSLKSQGILGELERLNSWEDFFKILFERFNGTVAFDEFQNFSEVDKSVYGVLQKNLDAYERKGKVLVILSGSMIGLIKKLFSDSKEPLYGRVKRSLHLKPIDFKNTLEIGKEIKAKSEDSIKLYSIFGGFPKYYVNIEDEGLCGKSFEKIMERLFFEPNAVLEDEVTNILAMEFGKRSGTYYDILTAIASGNTRISEIASFMRKKETAITRQVNELIHYFEIVGVEQTTVGNKKCLFIKHPLMEYWFKYFYKNFSDYKRRNNFHLEKIRKQTNSHTGRRFEIVCRESLELIFPNKFERIGRQWGKIKGKHASGSAE